MRWQLESLNISEGGNQWTNPVSDASKPLYYGQGWAVFSAETFFQRQARDKSGKLHNARIHIFQDADSLFPWQRNAIFKLQNDVFTVITQTSKIMAGLDWKVTPSREIEDEIAEKLKFAKWSLDQIGLIESDPFMVYENIKRAEYLEELNKYLGPFWLKPDLSNFDQCLRMWSRFLKSQVGESMAKIEDW